MMIVAVPLCRTRWVQRIDGLELFQTLHPSIIACMEMIGKIGRQMHSQMPEHSYWLSPLLNF